ncbi:hypothetical protein PG993_012767 [Apiospora rasikravindrae]|uniref:Uncharacterized protein n=1 Tax=Apiospora rasikravindrae TaxID=990691 RepID=A0ABR1RVQ7_9PEZI
MPSDPDSTNPFVRFKHRVDDQISQCVKSIWSSPSSSSNQAAQVGVGSHALHDAWPTTSNSSDGNTSNALTNADKSINTGDPNSQEMATLESAISHSLRDETVKSWVQYSAYSPLHLHHTLPAPLPKDVLSSGGYHRVGQFTFRDAFEDLLAVSSGQPLADRAELASRTEEPKQMLPATREDLRTGPNSEFFTQPPLDKLLSSGRLLPWDDWAASLDRRGRLWDAYFPPESFRPAARRIATIATSDLFRHEHTAGQAEGYIRKYIGDAAACEEERAWKRVQMFLGSPTLQGLFSELHGLGGPLSSSSPFPSFGEFLDDDDSFSDLLARSLVSGAKEVLGSAFGRAREWEEDAKRRGRDADTDEDLYRNVESDYARNSRRPRNGSLGLPPPMDGAAAATTRDVTTTQTGVESGNNANTKSKPENAEWTEEFPEPDGGKTVKSVTRKVGPWMTHETVKTTRYNAEGVVVQSMTQSQHAASKEFKWSSGSGSEDDESADGDEGKKKSSSGWFWTK